MHEHTGLLLEENKKKFDDLPLGEEMMKIVKRFRAEGVPDERKKSVRFSQQPDAIQEIHEEVKEEEAKAPVEEELV